MNFAVEYHEKVVREDIPKLSHTLRNKIRVVIEMRLSIDPAIFGKPLRKSLRGYRALRVSDYRVVFRIEGNKVKIFLIAHRSIVYKEIIKRL